MIPNGNAGNTEEVLNGCAVVFQWRLDIWEVITKCLNKYYLELDRKVEGITAT
jgi:hypothetical protein